MEMFDGSLSKYSQPNNKTTNDEILRYGVYLTDDNIDKIGDCTRIRTISYNGKIYYHKMVNGEVVEFRVIGKVE